jgi:DNA/RNA-binding domain of Phe-tRNA-synthetase-like protein
MKNLVIEVSEELKQAWPQFRGAAVFATVKNTAYNEELWKRIDEFTVLYRSKYTTDSIKEMPAIQATRQAYKKCGKDPSRYRPSSEALCRRILRRGIPLYQIDTLVDLICHTCRMERYGSTYHNRNVAGNEPYVWNTGEGCCSLYRS